MPYRRRACKLSGGASIRGVEVNCLYWDEVAFREADRKFDGGEFSDALCSDFINEPCNTCGTCIKADECEVCEDGMCPFCTNEWVVIAWTDKISVPDGRPFAVDLGYRPNLVEKTQVHACVWLRHGGKADVKKAHDHVIAEHPETGRVFTYPANENDPLGRARVEILRT